jgi:hypothetical protein
MSGSMLLLPFYTFMVFTGKILPLPLPLHFALSFRMTLERIAKRSGGIVPFSINRRL